MMELVRKYERYLDVRMILFVVVLWMNWRMDRLETHIEKLDDRVYNWKVDIR